MPPLVCTVTIQEQPANDWHPRGLEEVDWNPIDILDLRRLTVYTLFTWLIFQYYKGLVTAYFENWYSITMENYVGKRMVGP